MSATRRFQNGSVEVPIVKDMILTITTYAYITCDVVLCSWYTIWMDLYCGQEFCTMDNKYHERYLSAVEGIR